MNGHIPVIKLSQYIDSELEDQERLEVESHLAVCDPCRAECDSLKKMCQAMCLFKKCAVRNPDEFVRSTMLRVRKRRVISMIRHYAMPASAAAVILIVAGVSFFDTTFSASPSGAVAKTETAADVQTADIDYEDNVSSSTGIRDIVRVLERNGASVKKVTSDYVEAEAYMADYQAIRSDFDFAALPPTLAGRGLSLAGASSGAEMHVGAADRKAQMITFRIRRK